MKQSAPLRQYPTPAILHFTAPPDRPPCSPFRYKKASAFSGRRPGRSLYLAGLLTQITHPASRHENQSDPGTDSTTLQLLLTRKP
jgi:hypothetical protein